MRRWLLAATGGLILAGASPAAAQYPSPPPDFAHPGMPHAPLMSPASGNDPRPLLVILAVYSNRAETITTAQARNRFFAQQFGSVSDYYRAQSFGRFRFTPAAESEGTANDGVIRAPMGSTDDIETGGNDLGGAFGRQAIRAANATTTWVDFASFDENRNGTIEARELSIVVLTDFDGLSGCGGTRSLPGDTAADDVSFAGRQYSFDFGLENIITHAHELAHQAFATTDQFYIAGPYDITSPTCTTGTQPYFSFNSWHKQHLGWTQPRVVTRDGYYDVPNWTSSGTAFLLYDHAKGTGHYVLVENRQRGGYDPDLSGTGLFADSGLIVWRIDESAFGTKAFNLVRPGGGQTPNNYGGSSVDAFDPSDVSTPQRSVSPGWNDGTSSAVAVRAIGRSAATMRAYFDVRGPGVLVDSFDLDAGDPDDTSNLPRLSPGEANAVTFPVMNTGEASDSFDFTIAGLPAGWTATTDTRTLGAGASGNATVQVTPPLGARADQVVSLTVSGASRSDATVSSTAPLRVRVNPKVSIDDVTVNEGDAGTQDATFTVSLSEPTDRRVIANAATADGTAVAPADYETVSGSVRFEAGDTSQRFTVPVKGDTAPEPDEDFFVRLSPGGHGFAAKIVDGEGRGRILTDPEPSVSVGDARLVEDDAEMRFTVSLSEPNNTPVRVDYATADLTAVAGSDYAPTSGTLDFPVGETARTVAVPIREDVVDEADEETFALRLSSVVNAFAGDAEGIGTIRDDDRNGAFACRAVGVRLGTDERGVANPPRLPCRDDAAVGVPIRLGGGLLEVEAASAVTDQSPDDLTGTAPRAGDRATAHAEAAGIVIRAGLNLIRISGLVSDARAECTASGPPRLTSASRVTIVSVNGGPVLVVTGRLDLPLILATLRLNETVTGPNGITQRALVLDNAVGPDLVLGEAHAGWGGTPAHPNGHPCAV